MAERRTRKEYSEARKAASLAALKYASGNVTETARMTGISVPTLAKWDDGKNINMNVIEMKDDAEKLLADEILVIMQKIIKSLDLETIQKAPLNQRAVTFGILTDKRNILLNKPSADASLLAGLTQTEKQKIAEAALMRLRGIDGGTLTQTVRVTQTLTKTQNLSKAQTLDGKNGVSKVPRRKAVVEPGNPDDGELRDLPIFLDGVSPGDEEGNDARA